MSDRLSLDKLEWFTLEIVYCLRAIEWIRIRDTQGAYAEITYTEE